MTDDEFRREVRAHERGLARRSRFMQVVRHLNASIDEDERRREGLAPKPLAAPKPVDSDVDFITFREVEPPVTNGPSRPVGTTAGAAPGSWLAVVPPRSPNPGQSRAGHETKRKRKLTTNALVSAARDRLRLRGIADPSVNEIANEAGIRWETADKAVKRLRSS